MCRGEHLKSSAATGVILELGSNLGESVQLGEQDLVGASLHELFNVLNNSFVLVQDVCEGLIKSMTVTSNKVGRNVPGQCTTYVDVVPVKCDNLLQSAGVHRQHIIQEYEVLRGRLKVLVTHRGLIEKKAVVPIWFVGREGRKHCHVRHVGPGPAIKHDSKSLRQDFLILTSTVSVSFFMYLMSVSTEREERVKCCRMTCRLQNENCQQSK